MLDMGFEEQEADDDNHSRLFGYVSQNESENSKGKRKLKGTNLRAFIALSLPRWRPSSSTGGFVFFLNKEDNSLINESSFPPPTESLNYLYKFVYLGGDKQNLNPMPITQGLVPSLWSITSIYYMNNE